MNAMPAAVKSQRLPETMNLREIGAHMAGLRAGFGLSQQEVSERLHIRARYISAIEEGKLELLPGKVYARGYVHTYAEFLGLVADQVVGLCFAGEPPANVQKPMQKTIALQSVVQTQWRGYGILAVIGLLVALVISQVNSKLTDTVDNEMAVEAVPEEMLMSVRNLVMPTPDNYGCLTRDALLNCFYSDQVTQVLAQVGGRESLRFAGNIDVGDMMDAMPHVGEVSSEMDSEKSDAVSSEPAPDEVVSEPAYD
jgi:hypothetical protein